MNKFNPSRVPATLSSISEVFLQHLYPYSHADLYFTVPSIVNLSLALCFSIVLYNNVGLVLDLIIR